MREGFGALVVAVGVDAVGVDVDEAGGKGLALGIDAFTVEIGTRSACADGGDAATGHGDVSGNYRFVHTHELCIMYDEIIGRFVPQRCTPGNIATHVLHHYDFLREFIQD